MKCLIKLEQMQRKETKSSKTQKGPCQELHQKALNLQAPVNAISTAVVRTCMKFSVANKNNTC